MVAIVAIAALASLIALMASRAPGSRDAVTAIDNSFYDAAFKLRPMERLADSPVVVLEIDQASLDLVDQHSDRTWPWPRGLYGMAASKLEKLGAKAIVLDMLMSEKSAYGSDDDARLAELIDGLRIPLVMGVRGLNVGFIAPVTKPIPLGDTAIHTERTYRQYRPTTERGDSLALAGIKAAGYASRIANDAPFRLHYYGPHRDADGRAPFPAHAIGNLIVQVIVEHGDDTVPPEDQFDPAIVRDKIVIIGSLAAGLHDLKRTPVSEDYPGVEVHATAMLNMIRGQHVNPIGAEWVTILSALGAFWVASGVILMRAAWLKIGCIALVILGFVFVSGWLMQRNSMRWLPPTEPLLAAIVATVGSLLWVYKIEDARARALLKAIGQCISPQVARELAEDPSGLTVGGRRMELTILFTDLEGFTDLTERLQEGIEPVLNLYLAEMSKQAFDRNGTIDKYIGDAMMVFWNAPLAQSQHAKQACETALALVEHERKIAPKLAALGATNSRTRIGIHTGPVIVGFFGSRERLTYTAVGDSVNLAARLEPSNKIYGTQILVSGDTVDACGESMLFRPVDRLRVYGRREPVGVYELLGPREGATADQLWLVEQSRQAAQACLARDWVACLAMMDAVLAKFPQDGPARVWQARVSSYLKNSPDADWDGVWEQTTK